MCKHKNKTATATDGALITFRCDDCNEKVVERKKVKSRRVDAVQKKSLIKRIFNN